MTAAFILRDLVLIRTTPTPRAECPQDAYDRIVARILDREGAEFTSADVAGDDGPQAAEVALAFLADRQIITPVPAPGSSPEAYRAGPDLQADAIAAFWSLDGADPAPESDAAPGSVAPAPAPTPATASGMATLIRQVLDLTIEAATDPDDGMFELAEPLAGYEALTYEDAGIPTHDAGLVLRAADGRMFQITIVRSR